MSHQIPPRVKLRKNRRNSKQQKVPSETLQASVSVLNVNVYEIINTIENVRLVWKGLQEKTSL